MRADSVELRQRGLSYRQIARKVGATVGSVAGHLCREKAGGVARELCGYVAPFVRFGEENPAAKLSWPIVAEIRASSESMASLGRRYGVTRQTVRAVKQGWTWKHVA